jgi:hypothetical protein
MKYKVVLRRSEEGVAAYVPGLPGCHSQGETEGTLSQTSGRPFKSTLPWSPSRSRALRSEKSK